MCPDNYDRWRLHQAEQDRKMARLPECDCCGNKIYERYVELFGHVVCEDCIEDSWAYVED